jgi:eukaryotic-like serine/threonine-protein kinase
VTGYSCPSCGAGMAAGTGTCAGCARSVFAIAPGAVLDGRYDILETLGRGGMGMVYKAHDRELDETVAIKVLRAEIALSGDLAQRFRNEIRLARRIRHRNVCAIHEYGQHGPLRFIVMEHVAGVDLKQVLRDGGPLPVPEAIEVTAQVAAALQAIHEAGIVHRDLKTPNIMRDHRGVVRLMDFGIAKQLDGETGGATATGLAVGTPEYMSPEQARAEKVDPRTDVYALGVVFYELLTGRVPFRGETPIATMLMHLQEPPPVDESTVPAALVAPLRRALAKSRDERFDSAQAFVDALRAVGPPGPRAAARPAPAARTVVGRAPATARALEPRPVPLPAAAATPVPTAVRTQVPTGGTPAVDTDHAGRAPAAPAGPRVHVIVAATAVVGLAAVAAGLGAWLVRRSGDPAPGPRPAPTLALPAAATPEPTPPPATLRAEPATVLPPDDPAPPAPAATLPRATPRPSAPAAPRPSPRAADVWPSPAAVPPPWTAPTPPLPLAALRFKVKPWAEVSVDGRSYGRAQAVQVPPGQHVVVFAHPDYEPLRRAFVLAPGETRTVTVDMRDEAIRRRK